MAIILQCFLFSMENIQFLKIYYFIKLITVNGYQQQYNIRPPLAKKMSDACLQEQCERLCVLLISKWVLGGIKPQYFNNSNKKPGYKCHWLFKSIQSQSYISYLNVFSSMVLGILQSDKKRGKETNSNLTRTKSSQGVSENQQRLKIIVDKYLCTALAL